MQYETYAGQTKKYKLPHIREALATTLDIPYEQLWGPDGSEIVKKLIAEAVLKGAISNNNKTHDPNRKKWNLIFFIKNLIRLGYRPSNEKEKKRH
jgi:hypothetical protein